MDKMEGLSAQLDGMEAQVTVMKAVIDNDAVTRAQLLEAKDQIAQLNGNLEKLQVGWGQGQVSRSCTYEPCNLTIQ